MNLSTTSDLAWQLHLSACRIGCTCRRGQTPYRFWGCLRSSSLSGTSTTAWQRPSQRHFRFPVHRTLFNIWFSHCSSSSSSTEVPIKRDEEVLSWPLPGIGWHKPLHRRNVPSPFGFGEPCDSYMENRHPAPGTGTRKPCTEASKWWSSRRTSANAAVNVNTAASACPQHPTPVPLLCHCSCSTTANVPGNQTQNRQNSSCFATSMLFTLLLQAIK